MKTVDKSQLFYCYDISLMKYLQKNNVKYLTKAIHPESLKMFFLYFKSDDFTDKFNKFIENKKSNL